MTKSITISGGTQGSWDLAPGGLRDTHRQLRDQFEAAGSGESFKVSVTDVHPNHCFIPTISALGYQYQNLSNYQNTSSLPNPFTNLLGRNLVCTNEIPFDSYYGPASTNTFHVKPDNDGLQFLSRELSRTVAAPIFTTFTNSLCPNSGSKTYSVETECFANRVGQAQPITTYTWTLGSGLQLVSGQGASSVQIQPVANYTGQTSIMVTATRQGYSSASTTIPVRVASSSLAITMSTLSDNSCGVIKRFTAREVNTRNFQWQVDGLPYSNGNSSNNYIDVSFDSSVPSHDIYVTAAALCPSGTLTYGRTYTERFSANCPKRESYSARYSASSVYPNPVDNTLVLTPPEMAATLGPHKAVLYNSHGQEVVRTKGAFDTLMPTSDLPSGLYNLVVEHNGKTTHCHIQVQH